MVVAIFMLYLSPNEEEFCIQENAQIFKTKILGFFLYEMLVYVQKYHVKELEAL